MNEYIRLHHLSLARDESDQLRISLRTAPIARGRVGCAERLSIVFSGASPAPQRWATRRGRRGEQVSSKRAAARAMGGQTRGSRHGTERGGKRWDVCEEVGLLVHTSVSTVKHGEGCGTGVGVWLSILQDMKDPKRPFRSGPAES